MNWQTHVPNIFGIDIYLIFTFFLCLLYLMWLDFNPCRHQSYHHKINDNRFYDTSIYTVFFAVFFFNFDHMFFCFCSHILCFVIFPKVAYVSSLTSFNQKVVLFLATKPLTCAHINSIGLSSQCRTGVLNTSCSCKLAILYVL